jgi:hypothetical protein
VMTFNMHSSYGIISAGQRCYVVIVQYESFVQS